MAEQTNYMIDRVEFIRNGVTFKPKVFRPLNIDDAKGIVIFSHGLGYCDRQYKIDGESFAANGYLTCLYNLRGHAGTDGVWTLQDSVEDLLAAIDTLTKKYSFKNKDRICALGHSTGALIVLLASLKDTRIKFASLVTVLTCLTDSYTHWFKSGFNVGVRDYLKVKGFVPPLVEKFITNMDMLNVYRENKIPPEEFLFSYRYGLLSGNNWSDFFNQIAYSPDIIASASQLKIPLLLFRGEYDEIIDVHRTNQLYEALDKKIPSKLYITNSKNHFHNDSWGMIQSETMKFFDKFCLYSETQNPSRQKKILIIDDDKSILATLTNILKKSGFLEVAVAATGEEALIQIAKLKEDHGKAFDLIISDIRMPGLDGIETIKRMKGIFSGDAKAQSPVIFMTGYEGERTQQEAKDLGYVDYLFKPFDIGVFITSVKRQLEC